MSKRAALLLIVCMAVAAAPGQARVDKICAGVESLTLIHGRSRVAQSVDDPFGAIDLLSRLSRELRGNLDVFSPPAVIHIDRVLHRSVSALRRTADPGHPGFDTLAALTFSALARSVDDLSLLGATFGCAPSRPAGALVDLQPGTGASALSKRLWTVITRQTFAALDYAVIVLVMALLALVAFVGRRLRREHVRHMCRIPLHVVYGDECTVTVILDIALGGMKIEAPAADVGRDWVQMHFAGQMREGKIVWRNSYYAGVRFRTKLSEQALAGILEQNLKPLKDAGIEKTSTECFYPGCHLACSRHLPTAISVKLSRPHSADT